MKTAWWVTNELDKVFPESARPADAREHIELWAAGNETADAQVALAVPQKARVKKASFKFSPLQGPRRHAIDANQCRAYWEWFTYVHANPRANLDPATYLRKAPAFFPDAFLEEREIALRGGATQPAWISVSVPRDTPAGLYRGAVTFSLEYKETGELERIRVPILLHVWPFNLPDAPTLRHTEWFFPDLLADYYHLEKWSQAHWTWIRRVAEDMARHRQDTILTPFSKLARVARDRSGQFSFDFSRLDRWLDIFQSAGVRWVEGEHIAARKAGWQSPFVYTRWSPLDAAGRPLNTSALGEAQFEHYVEALLKAVHAHLRRRGLAGRYFQHVADEPVKANEASWRRIAEKVRRWLPGVPRIDAMMSEGLEGCCEIRVPQIQEIKAPSRCRPPEQLWSYVCLAPQGIYPNRFLDYPSIRNRIIYWLSWSLNLKGFLHWGYNYWHVWGGVPVNVPLSPWMDAAGASHYCTDTNPLPAGDPHIVYPGKQSICSSIRWETIRKGCEDYELLARMAGEISRPRHKSAPALKAGRELLSLARTTLARDPAHHTHDPARLLSARVQIGETIARLA